MKIIKSLSFIAVGLFTTTLLYAQQAKTENSNKPPQLKTEVLKQEEIKAPPQSGIMNTPSPQPELKPQPGTPLPKEAAAPTNTKPQQNDEEKSEAKALPKPKNVVLDNGTGDETKKLTPEQTNILNGKSERPKNSGVQVPKSGEQKTMPAQPVKQQQ